MDGLYGDNWSEDVVRTYEKRLLEYLASKREYEEARDNMKKLLDSLAKTSG